MSKRNWISYDVFRTGNCEAVWNGEPWTGRYEVGTYHSGRTRSYEGVFTSVASADGRKWIGRDRWCFVTALKELFREMQSDGLMLVCAGLDERYYQTGMSDGSGFGYFEGSEDEGAFHIFDAPIASPDD